MERGLPGKVGGLLWALFLCGAMVFYVGVGLTYTVIGRVAVRAGDLAGYEDMFLGLCMIIVGVVSVWLLRNYLRSPKDGNEGGEEES
jgi:hypothetical protein